MGDGVPILEVLAEIGKVIPKPTAENCGDVTPKSLDEVTRILTRHRLDVQGVYPSGSDVERKDGHLYISTVQYLIDIRLPGASQDSP